MIVISIVGFIVAGAIALVGGYAVWSGLQDAISIGKKPH